MLVRLSTLVALATLGAHTAAAQSATHIQATPGARGQVISIQPLSALFTLYAGELERSLSSSVTLGAGATYWSPDIEGEGFRYFSGDLKLRYYPSGRPFEGFSFGGTVGVTRVEATTANVEDAGESDVGLSIGTLLEHGWLLGEQKRFYVGLGIGAKALFIGEDEFERDVTVRYPTARISVGWAF